MNVSERFFQVNGYQLAAKEWNKGAAINVIACHGWLDNAASFDRLAALLDNCHIVALDMPGHGLSDHKPPQANYNIWDDLLDILAVADVMGWQGFNLLGHSRGAIMSMLLAAAMPERINALLMLDGIFPEPFDVADTARQLTTFLTEQRSVHKKRLPTYHSIEEAVMARCRAATISEASARTIVARGLIKKDNRFIWSSDPRLTTASAFKLTKAHILALVNAIRVPNLLLLAEDGLGSKEELQHFVTTTHSIHSQLIPGNHHFHMEEQAPLIADIIRHFFSEQIFAE